MEGANGQEAKVANRQAPSTFPFVASLEFRRVVYPGALSAFCFSRPFAAAAESSPALVAPLVPGPSFHFCVASLSERALGRLPLGASVVNKHCSREGNCIYGRCDGELRKRGRVEP